LSVEQLETRDLLTSVLHIDSAWVQRNAGDPIVLDQANTQYILDTDVDVRGTGFVVAAPNVTLNLNGHQVIYGDSTPLQVNNGGFESGDGNGVPGWDLSAAPGATRVPAITGMYGQWMLQLNNIASTQTIVSDPIAIPVANHEYAAAITPKGPYTATVTISVIDTATNAVVGTGTSRGIDRGFAAVAMFTPTTTDAVRLRIDVTPTAGQPATVDLDYAAVMPSRDYGIVATQAWTGELPAHLVRSLPAAYRSAANFTLMNGEVIQGQGHGNASSSLFFNALPGFTVTNVTTLADGMDTSNLDGTWASNGVITNSTFQGAIDRVSDRMNIVAAINLMNFDGTASIVSNRIVNVPQVGILFAGMPTEQSVFIANNDIRQDAIVTDGYGINLAGVQNFDVGHNTIVPVSGRGILLDGWGRMPTQNGRIHDNYVDIFEAPNLEYGDRLEATGLRLRNWSSTQRNLQITNNTFYAHTGPGGVYEALGARISELNDQGQTTDADNLVQGNVFKAIVNTTDPYYMAMALSLSNVGVGTGLQIINNLLESNNTSLNLGDNDSWQGNVDDVSLGGNSLRVSNDGPARNFSSVVAGSYENEVSNIRMPNTYLENGAPAHIVIAGSTVGDIEVEWLQGPPPGGDASGGAGARGSQPLHAVFGIGLDGQVWAEQSIGDGQWSIWTRTSPGVVKAISSVVDSTGNPQVFAIGLDDQVWMETAWAGGQWSGWSLTTGGSVKCLSAIFDNDGNAEIFVIGMDDQVWSETASGSGQWSGWSLSRGGAVKAISAIRNASGNPEVFAIRMDNQVWTETASAGGSWSNWSVTQGGAVKSLSAVLNGNGCAEVVAVGMDDQVWTEMASGDPTSGSWGAWNRTQGGSVRGINVFVDGNCNPEIIALGMDNQAWAESCTGPGQWSSWSVTQAGSLLQLAR
jgi:hypothetical protein